MSEENGLVNPFVLSDGDGYMWLKGNLHSHSTNSDGGFHHKNAWMGMSTRAMIFVCIRPQ